MPRTQAPLTDFYVRFWGVRGGYPAPQMSSIGGHTPCVEVGVAGRRFILDAGLGIVPLGQQYEVGVEPVVILLTHLHRDHIEGLGFFTPLRNPRAHVMIFGPALPGRSLEAFLSVELSPPVFPLPWDETLANCEVIEFFPSRRTLVWPSSEAHPVWIEDDASRSVEAPVIRLMHSWAHPQGVFIFRVEWQGRSVVYATDVEGYVGGDQRLIRFARGANLIIHDAQYTMAEYTDPVHCRQGWGHSTPEMAMTVARAAGVPFLAFFHHDPRHDDEFLLAMEAASKEQFAGAFLAREGMVLGLPAPGVVERLA